MHFYSPLPAGDPAEIRRGRVGRGVRGVPEDAHCQAIHQEVRGQIQV